jgi:predicted DNA-binding transcriptional regulator AlpA
MDQMSTNGTEDNASAVEGGATVNNRGLMRAAGRELALESAMRKRRAGVPTYTIPETAALCSVSHEHLYRQVRAGLFPALRLNGRYVVPAKAVDDLLASASAAGGCIDVAEWAASWQQTRGGAA